VSTSREAFEALVEGAMESLPDWVKDRLENVGVLVEDDPPVGAPGLLGLYEGIPLTRRGMSYAGVLPDRITLFRANLERAARYEEDLKRLVRHTVVHEFAHFFGISDDRLRELGRY
jgi:predicted Zn-dependent protease with MMP-like domain